jgi:hypothetical protein
MTGRLILIIDRGYRTTLTELRYIVAVAQNRHFGRAASRSSITQPARSLAVQKLEEELGVTMVKIPGIALLDVETGRADPLRAFESRNPREQDGKKGHSQA